MAERIMPHASFDALLAKLDDVNDTGVIDGAVVVLHHNDVPGRVTVTTFGLTESDAINLLRDTAEVIADDILRRTESKS